MRYLCISILLIVIFIPVLGFDIHNLDYENSLYNDKKMPSIGKPVQLLYQVENTTPENKRYDVTISITNLDEDKQVYHAKHHYEIKPEKFEDIMWSFTPETEGLYSVEVIENSGKNAKYVFAAPKDEDLRHMAKENSTFLEDKSPMQQFRIGLDPKEIRCKEDLYLALKPSSLPVCVSLETLKELRQRDLVISEFIDYERIGHFLSEIQFQKMLAEKNIEYTPDNFLLIQGMMQPTGIPTIGYCGHVLSDNNEIYWFSSSSLGYALTSYGIHDENPHPCKAGEYSCECSLQTTLVEKNLKELSYFDKSQEAHVGKIFQDYLNEGNKVVNVPDSFVIGKYNLEIASDIISFCGQFKGKYQERYFLGHINGSEVVNWSLEPNEKPKLCAINEDSQTYHFKVTKSD